MGRASSPTWASRGSPGTPPSARKDASGRGAPAAAQANGWETLFWLVFNRSNNPIVLLDEQQRLLEINDAAVTVFQRGRGELLGRPLPELIIPADRGAAARQWGKLMRAGEGTGVRVMTRPDGTNVEVDWAARVASIGGRQVAIGVMLRTSALAERSGAATAGADLTRREREVVTLIALGHDTREIASLLVVSPETVKSHVRKAMSKLQARTRAQLVAVALATGQIAQVAPLDG